MYGQTFGITHRGITVTLRAFSKEDIPCLVKGFSSMSTVMYTNMLFAQVYENEVEWFEKTRKSSDVVSWAIVPEGCSEPIGVTALHDIQAFDGSCTSGIIIWEKSWWGKGVASASHLIRTLFAVDYLNRSTIKSCVRSENPASYKALQRIGYTIWGTEPDSVWREGNWIETHHLKWFHPERTDFLFPRGIPEKYQQGIENARLSLDLARKNIVI